MKERIKIIIPVLVVIMALLACDTRQSNGVSTPQATTANEQTITPTVVITTKPQPTATKIPPTNTPILSGLAILGATIGSFNGHYGSPNAHSNTSTGEYHYQKYADSNVDLLIVNTDIADGGVYAQRAYSITVQADTSGWTQQQTDDKCKAFFPSDATYKSQAPTQNGYDKIYFSSSLASLFPASAFTDANQKQIQSGYFDVLFLISGSMTNSCTIAIGTQQTTS